MCLNESKSKIALNRKIQLELKLCETNGGSLSLKNFYIISSHMNLILQAILSNNDYLKILKSIDLSSNILNDDFLLAFFNSIEKFSNLQSLNLSNNQFTIKSLIYFSTVVKKTDPNKKLVCKFYYFYENNFKVKVLFLYAFRN
jgi:hypothetical protein